MTTVLPHWGWALPLGGLVVGVVFGAGSVAGNNSTELSDASGLIAYGAFFGAVFGLIVGALGSLGGYLVERLWPLEVGDLPWTTASGAALGVATGWGLLLAQSVASTGTAADLTTFVFAFVSTTGAFVATWLSQRSRRLLNRSSSVE